MILLLQKFNFKIHSPGAPGSGCGQAAVPGPCGWPPRGAGGHRGVAGKPTSRKSPFSLLPPLEHGHCLGRCLSRIFEDFLLKACSVPCSGEAQLGEMHVTSVSLAGTAGTRRPPPSVSSSAVGGRVGTAWPPGDNAHVHDRWNPPHSMHHQAPHGDPDTEGWDPVGGAPPGLGGQLVLPSRVALSSVQSIALKVITFKNTKK